jgi:XTP/dITP diphosphohydrolase
MELLLATRNAHKVEEFARILAPHTVLPLPDDVVLPPETGTTFAENALLKARAAAEATGRPAFADDSGIAAAALDGAPGIYSARFAGDGATDEANLDKLLHSVPRDGDRRVAYVCAIVFYVPGQVPHVFEETCEGLLAPEPRGTGGFGYDPAFLPIDIDDGRTMAEVTADEKDAISHRGRAARAFRDWLEEQEEAA